MTLGLDKFEGYAILKFGDSRICKNAGQLGLGSSRLRVKSASGQVGLVPY